MCLLYLLIVKIDQNSNTMILLLINIKHLGYMRTYKKMLHHFCTRTSSCAGTDTIILLQFSKQCLKCNNCGTAQDNYYAMIWLKLLP